MKVYTDAEYDRLYRESLSYEQIESNLRGFDEIRAAQSQWSEEQARYANLLSGIELDIVDKQIFLDRNQLSEHYDCAFLTAKFYLSGYHSAFLLVSMVLSQNTPKRKDRTIYFIYPTLKRSNNIGRAFVGRC